jgi:hypothetical protein
LDFTTSVLRGFYAFNALAVSACVVVFYVRRVLWRRRKGRKGFFPTYTAAGNALQVLQTMAEPRTEYVIEEKLQEEAEDDDEGDGADPAKYLDRQLRRIRRGAMVGRLTVRARG